MRVPLAAALILAGLLFGGCSSPSDRAAAPAAAPAAGEEAAQTAAPEAAEGSKAGYVLLLAPEIPSRNGPIQASLRDAATHAERPAASWNWFVNGDRVPVTDPVLPPEWFRRGDEIRAEAVPRDDGLTVSSRLLRAANAPPAIGGVGLEPTAPRKGDVVTATARTLDPDGDPVRVRYKWFLNGKPVREDERNAYSLDGAKKGDQLHCEAIPDDGYARGPGGVSPVVEVVNASPRILSVPPSRAAPGAPFVYLMRVEDPDGDPLRIELAAGPPGIALDGETIRWTPPADASGALPVVVRVTDGAGGEARQEFTLTVSK